MNETAIHPHHEVRSDGRVFIGARELTKNVGPFGYATVCLRRKKFSVARLVAGVHCEGYFPGAVVIHKDFDNSNDCADNLEWVHKRVSALRAESRPQWWEVND